MLLSPIEVLECIQFAQRIYNHFSNISASHQYHTFQRDIGSLRNVLEELGNQLQELHHEFRGQSGNNQYSWRDQSIGREIGEIIGDCKTTLLECQKFLEDNHWLGRGSRRNFVNNVYWSAQGRDVQVSDLKDRLRLNMEKVQFVVASTQLTSNGIIRRGLDEVLKNQFVEHISDLWRDFPLPERLARKLNASSFNDENCPQIYRDDGQFPLREGCDALLWALTKAKSLEGDAYKLHLRKAQWVLRKLLSSPEYRGTESNSQYRRQILEKGSQIWRELSDASLLDQSADDDDADLCNINDEDVFLIWMPPQIVTPADPLLSFANEERILEVELDNESGSGSDNPRLIFFRQSPIILRSSLGGVFDTSSDRLVVRYNIPNTVNLRLASQNRALLGLEIRRQNQRTGGALYEFKTLGDLFACQQAYTGFSVHSDIPCVKWVLETKSATSRQLGFSGPLKGIGRLQLWRFKPRRPIADNIPSAASDASPVDSTGSVESPASLNSQLSHITRALNAETFSLVDQDNFRTNGSVLASYEPVHPRLLIFTFLENKSTIICLELKRNMRAVPEVCNCRNHPDACKEVIIEDRAKRRPGLLRSTENAKDYEARVSSGDVFDIAPFGIAQGSPEERANFGSFADGRTKLIKTSLLQLSFEEWAHKDSFCKKLDEALQHRNAAASQVQALESSFGNPSRSNTSTSQGPSRTSSYSTTSTQRNRSNGQNGREGTRNAFSVPTLPNPTLSPAFTVPFAATALD